MNRRLVKQQKILSISDKESKLIFSYQDEKALLKGQKILIDLGYRLQSLLNEDRE